MSIDTFSDEEVTLLRQNPYTLKVNNQSISFTKEFKDLFIAEYSAGATTSQILHKCGYDPKVIGYRRSQGISHRIRVDYGEKIGKTIIMKSSNARSLSKASSDKDELKRLRHEVDYMKQEIEFLKKFPRSEIQGSR